MLGGLVFSVGRVDWRVVGVGGLARDAGLSVSAVARGLGRLRRLVPRPLPLRDLSWVGVRVAVYVLPRSSCSLSGGVSWAFVARVFGARSLVGVYVGFDGDVDPVVRGLGAVLAGVCYVVAPWFPRLVGVWRGQCRSRVVFDREPVVFPPRVRVGVSPLDLAVVSAWEVEPWDGVEGVVRRAYGIAVSCLGLRPSLRVLRERYYALSRAGVVGRVYLGSLMAGRRYSMFWVVAPREHFLELARVLAANYATHVFYVCEDVVYAPVIVDESVLTEFSSLLGEYSYAAYTLYEYVEYPVLSLVCSGEGRCTRYCGARHVLTYLG